MRSRLRRLRVFVLLLPALALGWPGFCGSGSGSTMASSKSATWLGLGSGLRVRVRRVRIRVRVRVRVRVRIRVRVRVRVRVRARARARVGVGVGVRVSVRARVRVRVVEERHHRADERTEGVGVAARARPLDDANEELVDPRAQLQHQWRRLTRYAQPQPAVEDSNHRAVAALAHQPPVDAH